MNQCAPAAATAVALRLASAALVLAALATGCRDAAPIASGGASASWPFYGGDAAGRRYSPLDQITPANIAALELAWTHHHGDLADSDETRGKSSFQATPIVVGDTLYYCTPLNRVFALDPETGTERWVYDPEVDAAQIRNLTCRGVAYWADPAAPEDSACRERIFTGTVDARLIAIDARTGQPCADFGSAGQVDLLIGIGEAFPGEYGVSSPPTVIRDVVAVGALVADNRRVDAPAGVVRGFDARSGALRWAFDPVPPGTPPRKPEPMPENDGTPSYHVGTAHAWSIFSADPERDLLFVPTGNTSPDFYGGQRHGIDHYSSSVVALRGATGEVVWHFQTVHHDLWDYDVSSQPTLLDVPVNGALVPGVAQPTKMGHIFLLDRETGRPLYAVEERPVPQRPIPGETLSPTQPFPTHPPPLHPHTLSPDEAWGLTPWDRASCRDQLATLRNDGIFTPPSLEGSIQYPGVAGGTNWGSAAYDPERRLLVLGINRVANVQTAVPRDEVDWSERRGVLAMLFPQTGTPYVQKQEVLISSLGIPCNPPPWGTLVAVDLESGQVRWEVPLGSIREQAPVPIDLELGLPHAGGPLVTASGLVFIGASMDSTVRALDVETGETLWRARLPAGGQATPLTYRLENGARQLVVIAAGGHGTLGTRRGDSLVAYALP